MVAVRLLGCFCGLSGDVQHHRVFALIPGMFPIAPDVMSECSPDVHPKSSARLVVFEHPRRLHQRLHVRERWVMAGFVCEDSNNRRKKNTAFWERFNAQTQVLDIPIKTTTEPTAALSKFAAHLIMKFGSGCWRGSTC